MSRTGRPFKEVFDELAAALDMSASDVAGVAALQSKLLHRFNRAYENTYSSRRWEDAWVDAELTPTSRLLTMTQVEDARHFEFWSEDPRDPDNNAYEIGYVVDADGITLNTDLATVYAFYLPKCKTFTLTAWSGATAYVTGDIVYVASTGHNYVALQNGTNKNPTTETAYWRTVPVLTVLAEPVCDLAAARHLIDLGKFEAGNARKADARERLEREAQFEFGRLARQGGRPWRVMTGSLETCCCTTP